MIAVVVLALTRDSTEQIEHVELDGRIAQQMDDVAKSLGVLQAKHVRAVADGPVLALFAEDSLLHGTGARPCIGYNSRAIPRARRLSCHPNFCRWFRRLPRKPMLSKDRTIRADLSPQIF